MTARGIPRKLRRKIFYLLIAVFVIIAPFLIAYALGYTFDFTKRSIAKIGAIFVKSSTTNLSVYLNNEFQKNTSIFSGGALLTTLEPNTYLVRLERSDYQPWSKTVEVDSGMVTEIRNILLIPNPLVYATSTSDEISYLAATASDTYGYRLDSKNNLFYTTSNTAKKIASEVRFYGQGGTSRTVVFFVNDSGFLAKFDSSTGEVTTLGRPGFYMDDSKPMKFAFSTALDLAVTDSAGGVYLLKHNDNTISIIPNEGGATNISFDKDGNKLLVVKDDRLDVVWMADNPQQPFQKKGDKEQIIKTDSKILDAGWYFNDNNHIVFRTKEGIFITEIDGRGGRNTAELFSGTVTSLTTATNYPNDIFFKKGKNTFKIEL